MSGEARSQTDGGCPCVPPCWHEGTERPIHRPTDPEDQQDSDSGTKTCHTLKHLLVIDEPWPMGFLRTTDEGQAHDQSLADLAGYTLPQGSWLSQDMGFQGYTGAGSTMVQPKPPPGGELTPPEQTANRAISSIRIRIAHAIGGVKRYRIAKDKIRLLKDGIRDTIMATCCGRHNFRLQDRPWNYAT